MSGLDRIAFCELKGSPDHSFLEGPEREFTNQAAILFSNEIFDGEYYVPEMTRVMNFDPEYHTVVALDPKIGLIGAGVLRYYDLNSYAHIDWLAVSEHYRGHGLGTRIIELLERILVTQSNIRDLRIYPTTPRSRELYARLGYTGEVEGKPMKKTLHS